MKKIGKIVVIILICIIILYSLLVVIEVQRFNKYPGKEPLVIIKVDTNIEAKKDTQTKVYTGLGYKVEYEYKTTKKSDDILLVNYLTGDFYLFGKRLVSWIQ